MEAQTLVQPSRGRGARSAGGQDAHEPAWRAPLLLAGLACAAVAAVSAAALPTVPSYDPWAWIVWGREVVDPHISFAVGGGPSWKPLPVIFTTILALFGGAAPTLWVIVARAAGLLGIVAAWRVARGLVGGGAWGAVAGALAAAGVVLTQQWGYYMFRGTSEPLLIATSLWAVDRHLDGRRGSAFLLGVATALMRPEAWPFLGLYATWLWWREARLRGLLLVGLAAVPFFWFIPPWSGSGQPFLAATHAHAYNGHLGSDRLATVLQRGADLQVLPALITAAVAALLAFGAVARGHRGNSARDRHTLWLAGLVVGWWVVVVGTTLGGYPGLERFYLPAAALTCALAGAGAVRIARGAGALLPSGARTRWLRSAGLPALVVVALAGATVPFTTLRLSDLRAQEPIAARAVKRLNQLSAAVTAVGGHHGAYPCRTSFAAINHSVQTALAWKLEVSLGRVGTSMRHQGLMFVGPHDSIDGSPPRVDPRLTQRELVAQAGVWRVYRMTSPGAHTGCVGPVAAG